MDNGTIYCIEPAPIKWFTYVAYITGSVLCMMFGVCGTIYSLFLLTAKAIKVSLVKYLMALCVWDIFLLLGTFGFYGMIVILSKGFLAGPFSYSCWICYPLVNTAMVGSLWTVVVISRERYRAVAEPLSQRINEVQPVKCTCIFILLGAILINAPTVFELDIMFCVDKHTELLTPVLRVSPLRLDWRYLLVYRVLLYLTFHSVGPFLVVFYFTVRTMCLRKSAYKTRRRLTSFSTLVKSNNLYLGERRTAVLLMVMVFKLLVCHMAPTLMNIIELWEPSALDKDIFATMSDVSNLLVILHSATNWLIYCRWHQAGDTTSQCSRSGTLTKPELTRLRSLWEQIDPQELGVELIETQMSGTFRKISVASRVFRATERLEPSTDGLSSPLLGERLALLGQEPRRSSMCVQSTTFEGGTDAAKLMAEFPLRRTSSYDDACLGKQGAKVGAMLDNVIADIIASGRCSADVQVKWQLVTITKRKDAYTRDLTRRFLAFKLAESSLDPEDREVAAKISMLLMRPRKNPPSRDASTVTLL